MAVTKTIKTAPETIDRPHAQSLPPGDGSMGFRRAGWWLCLFMFNLFVWQPLLASDAPGEQAPHTVRVAGIVLKWLRQDKEANFRRAVPLIREAAVAGAQVVCTTECFLDGYAIADKSIPFDQFGALAENVPGGKYFEQLKRLADDLDVQLIAGMLERDGEQLFNTAVILGPDGTLIGRYRKQKGEHELVRLTPGHESSVFDMSWGKLGVMICADRRFQDVVGGFCSNGAELLICPSGGMFGSDRNDGIVQARSREFGKYIVFVHPAEFLVTRPDGTIARRVILGDRLEIDQNDLGTDRDSKGIFYFDVPVNAVAMPARNLAEQLQQPLLDPSEPWDRFREFVDEAIPDLVPPESRQQWESRADAIRDKLLDQVVFRGGASHWRDAKTRVEWFGEIETGDGYKIRKLAYEALPDFWIPALLYEPSRLDGTMPVMVNVNGHHAGGKAMPYKQRRCINLAKRGMLALNLEFIGMGQLHDSKDRLNRHNALVQLDLCGASGLAPFYLTMTRGLDVLLAHEHADPTRVGVCGLSGGGWQSIWLAACDTRITLANPVAGYCSLLARTARRNNIGDAEQIPNDLCTAGDYTHMTALVAPRPLLLTFNAQDNCCFLPTDVLDELKSAAIPVYDAYESPDSFRVHINHDPGTHNFDRDNREALYRLLGDFFFPHDPRYRAAELDIPDSEIKTAEELAVPLPPENTTLHSLAVDLSRDLPRSPDLPNEPEPARQWQVEKRRSLHSIVQPQAYSANASLERHKMLDGIKVTHGRLELGEHWQIPLVQFEPDTFNETTVVISDDGRASLGGLVQQGLASGRCVLAIDLLNFGESKLHRDDGRNDEIALHLLATTGRRPLGIMASQLTAVCRWRKDQSLDSRLHVHAVGPRSSLIALSAAALNETTIDGIELQHSLASLKELIERNTMADEAAEMFCFGLLEEFDISQMMALVAPRPVVVHDPLSPHRWELRALHRWYATLGIEFDPLMVAGGIQNLAESR